MVLAGRARAWSGAAAFLLVAAVSGCADVEWTKPNATFAERDAAVGACEEAALAGRHEPPVQLPFRDAYGQTPEDRMSIVGRNAYRYDIVSPALTARVADAGNARLLGARRDRIGRCMEDKGWTQAP